MGLAAYLKLGAAAIAAAVIGLLAWQNASLRNQLITARVQIEQQNAAVDAWKADGDRRLAAARRVIELAAAPRQAVVDAARAPAAGDTELERIHDIDRRFTESLR